MAPGRTEGKRYWIMRWVWLTVTLVTGCVGMVLVTVVGVSVPSSVVIILPLGVSLTDSPGMLRISWMREGNPRERKGMSLLVTPFEKEKS